MYSIENKFYVNDITNYVKQDVTSYVKREPTCENILTPHELAVQETMPTIYDAYITAGEASSFYMPYKVFSAKKLYKRQNYMIWNQYYNGYTSTSGSWYTENKASNTVTSQGSNQSSNQSSGPSFKPEEKRKLLVTTLTLLNAIAAPPIIGFNRKPLMG